jgi:hypothetical protein
MAQPSPSNTEEKRPTLLEAQRKTALRDFIVKPLFVLHVIADHTLTSPTKRIFSFSTWLDKVLLVVALVSSLGVGVTMPAMNIIFGMPVAKDSHIALLSKMQVGW